MKVTKSVVLDDEEDADLLEWATTQRISFSAVVRQALYAAMQNDRQGRQNDQLDLVAIRQVMRAELRSALNGLALATAPPAAAPTEVEDELEAALDSLF